MICQKALLVLQAGLLAFCAQNGALSRRFAPLAALRAMGSFAGMIRIFVTLLFSAVLALTSVSLAQARHYDGNGLQMVLCTAHGYRTVTIDAQGNPVSVTQPCPDCVAAMAAQDLPVLVVLPVPLQTGQPIAFASFARGATANRPPTAFARGPPLM